MSLSVCSISGQPLQHPVASLKTGHLYEKQTIQKHLNSFPYCPITNQPLALSDLVDIQPHHDSYSRPDQSPVTYMGKLQNQYNNLVLDIFNLKKSLKQTQQQITSSLYENQAANRVIAKLLKEKEDVELETQKLEARIKQLKKQ